VIDDYCGTPPGHIGPHGPLPFRINVDEQTLKQLSEAQRTELQRASREYPAIANAAFDALGKLEESLNSIAKTVAVRRI